jgi:hypothetical protein
MWTDERRQRQSEVVRKAKAWQHSTGPRTTDGKAKVSQNARKHGLRGGIFRQAQTFLALNNKLLKELK